MSPEKMSNFSHLMPLYEYKHLMHQQLRDCPLFTITTNQFNHWSNSKSVYLPQLPQKWSAGIAAWTKMNAFIAGFHLVPQELEYPDDYMEFCDHV
jgi:hypothetical protein